MKKRILALVMSVCMIISMMPVSAIASDHVHDASCGYAEAQACDHTHNTECGYAAAVEGAACTHSCSDESCAYAEAVEAQECQHAHDDCAYVAAVEGQLCGHTHGDCSYQEAVDGSDCGHTHDGSCGYAEAVSGATCTHACASDGCPDNGDGTYACQHTSHDGICGYSEGTPASACTHSHDSNCGYAEAVSGVACDHSCVNGSSCGYVEAVSGVDCDHTHNGSCGYVAAVAGVPCDHSCVSGGTCGYVEAVDAQPCTHEHDADCGYSAGSDCTYVEPVDEVTTYYVSVNSANPSWGNLSGTGFYALGDTVTISATPHDGYHFYTWVVAQGNITLANAASETTTFTMPAENVTVTANLRMHEFIISRDNEDGTHSGSCLFCDVKGEPEPHTLGDYEEDGENGHYANCTECTYQTGVDPHAYDDITDIECNVCGHIREAHQHSFSVATCTTPATCSCGTTTGDVDKSNHTGGTEVRNQKDATEFEAGYTGDTYCLGCGDKLSNGQTIPATHTHSYSTATCATPATCSCGVTTGSVDSTNHVGGTEIRNQVDAGEFTEGYTGDTYCKGCGDKLADGQTIPATHTHSYDSYAFDRNGHWKVCSCGDSLATEDHDWYIYKKDANKHYWRCDCGNNGWGNDHFDNNDTGKCDDCGYEMHTHNYTAVVTAPTCKEQGYTTYTCSCNDSYVSDYVDALDHDWGDYVSIGNGRHTRVCRNDSSHDQTMTCGGRATCHELAFCPDCKTTYGEYDQKNHSGGTEVRNAKDATETENGYTGDTYCLGCETLLNEGSIIYATGSGDGDDDTHTHNYSYYNYDGTNHWKMCHCGQGQAGSVKPHSLVTTGASTGHFEECTVCNYYSDVEAHVYSDDSDAYCNECGYRRYVHDYSTAATCSSPAKCGCGATTGSKDPTNHVGGTEIRNAKEATETENGYTGDTYCKGCGAKLASGKRTNKLGFVDVKYDDDVVVKEVTFQPIKGVDISDDAEVIVKDHTATLAPVDSLVGRDVNTEYLDINDLDITIIENDVYTHPDGTEYRIGEIISINGEEYVISNWVGTGDHLSLTRLSDGASCLYNAVTNVLDFGGSLITTPGEYPFERVNIGGVTYDVVLYFADIEGSGITTYLYYNGIPVGKMRSGDYYFCEGYDPATLAAQQDDNILGRITADNTSVVDLTPGKTYNVSVIGSNDIHLEGAENVGGTVTQTFEVPAEFVGNENVKYIAVHDTNPYADALAEALAKQVENFTMEGAQEYLDIKALYDGWAEVNAAGKTDRVSGIDDEGALLDDAENASDALAVQYTAKQGIVGGYELGKTFLSEDGKTLTATYEVDSFSPFIVYAFVEADEPEIKEFVTQPDGTLVRVIDGQPVTTHTVASGENLTDIARKYGCTVDEIVALNSDLIENPSKIYVGWELVIPGK